MAGSPHLEGVQLDEVVTALRGIASLRRYAAGDRQALVDDEVRWAM